MVKLQRYRTAALVLGAGVALSGCVAAVPATQTTLTVIPGQGKTAENLHADDAACRGTGSVGASVAATAPTLNAAAVTSEQYYACMASRGEAVIEQQTQVYPTYAAYSAYAPAGYPAYAYDYGYPYGGYPYYGYGGGYFGPYVGFGIGFGYGGFYGRGYGGRGFGYGGYRGGYGGYRGGYGGFRSGYGGGFHGGGFHR